MTAPRATPADFPARTPEELDALATITDADVGHAQRAWRQDAPPRFQGLLDATDRPAPRRTP